MALKPVFNEVLQSSGSDHVQCTFEWLSLWLKHLGSEHQLLTLLALKGDRAIGIAPLAVHRRSAVYRGAVSLRTLSFVGHGFTDSSDFLVVEEREQVLNAFIDYMFQNSELWDEMCLAHLSDQSPNFELLRQVLDREEYELQVEALIGCPYLRVEGEFEPYYIALGKNLKHDVAKKMRRLGEAGIELDFDVLTQIDDNLLEELRDFNRKRFEATQHRSFFLDERRYGFVREVAGVFNQNGWWRLFLFRNKGALIAYRLCFAYGNVLYDWNTSYDVDYFKYSLGKILLKPVLEYCFEHGFKLFDFMAGDEDYKLKWTRTTRTNCQISVQKRSLKTRLARVYSRARKKLKKR
ncbi:MAG: GNAT family N-acetyltransferase [Candidatus Eiseniibacteriota bacterium]|nr:MAG: GNAT family N-acetyltransferase [Candidatus Eisenbacteria bacterium]